MLLVQHSVPNDEELLFICESSKWPFDRDILELNHFGAAPPEVVKIFQIFMLHAWISQLSKHRAWEAQPSTSRLEKERSALHPIPTTKSYFYAYVFKEHCEGMAFSPAFVPSVAPISLRSQSSSLNGVRPVVHRVARVNRRAVICAASPVVIKSDQFDQEVLQAVRCQFCL